jgi:hypothetical protein
MIARAEATEAR